MFKDPITRRGMMLGTAAVAGAALLAQSVPAEAYSATPNGWGGTGAKGRARGGRREPLAAWRTRQGLQPRESLQTAQPFRSKLLTA